MSMIGKFLRVTKDELDEYINDSSLLENRIDADGSENDINAWDIDKSWDALSFLITGYGSSKLENAKPPLYWTIFGAQILDENQDLGYGPASYLTPEQVNELNNALINVSALILKEKYNAVKMNELGIYPNSWYEDEDEVNYLVDHFNDLKEFYRQAKINGQAVITYLS